MVKTLVTIDNLYLGAQLVQRGFSCALSQITEIGSNHYQHGLGFAEATCRPLS